jgi:hypothetical protein
MSFRACWRAPGPVVGFSAVLLVMAGSLQAQEKPVERTPPGEWVITTTLGAGAAGGGYGEFLEKPINFDLSISRGTGPWRLGFGIEFGSMLMKPPYEDQLEWARFDTYLFAQRLFNHEGRVQPYLQARVGLTRVHPRSEIFWFEDPENLDPGASPTKAVNGVSFTLQPGVQIQLNPTISLDLSGWFTAYHTADYRLTPPLPENRPLDPPLSDSETVNSGREYGFRAGLNWRPLARGVPVEPAPRIDPATGSYFSLPPADKDRDAWGVPRSWGWATAEMLGINFGASMFNEYVRQANFNQISPRSWWHNLEEGWTWDDNEFKTNQLVHPFNGSAYFNAARANGLGFWSSSLMSNVGAFIWECCGETHPMSWNDMISTGVGGMARGELSYRVSSLILDNTKTGWRRYMREFAAAPFNPIRTFNRFLSHRATTQRGNPVDPYDWRPPVLGLEVMTGARVIGEGESITENTNWYGFLEGALQYGSPFANERREPFDRFDADMALNLGDKTRIGRLTIRGDLASWPLGDDEVPRHSFALTQDFDYVDNEAYEFGGQFFGVALFSGYGKPTGLRLWTRLEAYASPVAAVNADYSFLADVADRERYREYDYGPGVGGAVEMLLIRNLRPILAAGYRYCYVDVRNGSIYNPEDGGLGSNASHQVHRFRVRVLMPLGQTLGIGADWELFYRDSRYSLPILKDRTQRNPAVRLFLTWDLGYTRKRAERAAASAD